MDFYSIIYIWVWIYIYIYISCSSILYISVYILLNRWNVAMGCNRPVCHIVTATPWPRLASWELSKVMRGETFPRHHFDGTFSDGFPYFSIIQWHQCDIIDQTVFSCLVMLAWSAMPLVGAQALPAQVRKVFVGGIPQDVKSGWLNNIHFLCRAVGIKIPENT